MSIQWRWPTMIRSSAAVAPADRHTEYASEPSSVLQLVMVASYRSVYTTHWVHAGAPEHVESEHESMPEVEARMLGRAVSVVTPESQETMLHVKVSLCS